ncbi:MAG TPA: hypothetical protein VH482_13370 [Thermomicrobiales bacterium]|jgi:hypothetical protein
MSDQLLVGLVLAAGGFWKAEDIVDGHWWARPVCAVAGFVVGYLLAALYPHPRTRCCEDEGTPAYIKREITQGRWH